MRCARQAPSPAARRLRSAVRGFVAVMGLALSAAAAQAADFRLENRVYDIGFMKITVREADVRGADLDKASFERLIDPAAPEPFAARASRLNATRIIVPEITLETALLGASGAWRIRDIVLNDLRAGRIASFTMREGDGRATDKISGEQTSSWRDANGEVLDIAALANALTGTRPVGTAPAHQAVIGRMSVASLSQSQGRAVSMTQGPVQWRGFQMSPGTKPATERFGLVFAMANRSIEAQAKGQKAPEPDMETIAGMLDLWDDIRFGANTSENLRFTFKQDKAQGIDSDGEMTIRRIALADTGDVSANLFAMEGLAGAFGPAQFSLSRLSFEGFSFVDGLRALRADLAAGKRDPDGSALARYMPKLGRLSVSGLDMTFPDESQRKRGPAPPPLMRIGLGEMEMAVRAQENGWPTDMRLAIERLTAPVSPTDSNSRALIEMGYTQLELGSRLDLAWDKTRNVIALREFGLDGRDMLKFTLGGTIGNAGKDLFSNDLALAQVAALGLTVSALEAKLENSGLFDKLLESEARKARKEPAALRRDWGAMAAIALPMFLGDSAAAKALAGAISRFIAKPGTLEIKAAAPAPGIGLADVIAVGDPKALLGRIDLKAEAR